MVIRAWGSSSHPPCLIEGLSCDAGPLRHAGARQQAKQIVIILCGHYCQPECMRGPIWGDAVASGMRPMHLHLLFHLQQCLSCMWCRLQPVWFCVCLGLCRNCSICSRSFLLCRVSGPPARRGRSKSPSRIRHKSSLSRSKSRSRSRSPRSPSRHGGRYKCEPPKFPPYTRHRTIPDLSKRYVDLYIPPEFCRAGAGWLDSLPDHKPINLVQPIDLQVNKVCI